MLIRIILCLIFVIAFPFPTLAWETQYTVPYSGNVNTAFTGCFDDDYQRHNVSGYTYQISRWPNRATVTFWVRHRETEDQTEYVNQRVGEILADIITPGMGPPQKEKAVHDYIINHVEYDTSLTRCTAYAALADGKATCRGYALLAHKMLTTAGIEARIARDNEHMWNIVRLDGEWYHLDCTWDDQGSGIYEYYNLREYRICRPAPGEAVAGDGAPDCRQDPL